MKYEKLNKRKRLVAFATKGKKMFGNKNEKQPDMEFFTVYDSKAKIYNEPFPMMNRDVVIREFTTAFRASPEQLQKNRYYQNSEDFKIFKIGEFDVKTGLLSSTNVEHICNLHDLRSAADALKERGALLPT